MQRNESGIRLPILVERRHNLTHLPARSRRSDSRSAGAAGSDADCRGESANAAVGRGME